jgi:hypothetical protein
VIHIGTEEIRIRKTDVPACTKTQINRIKDCGFAAVTRSNDTIYGSGRIPVQLSD